ncbi:AfsR/SARP family transcriptional regulator [Phytohabitans rumicis]|uniref:SARP family transcriptional regulator n=1 Tax=Phytohabitans rumicis TaxID=1076125 RepID=A0A6V8KNZ6_9ACTN|nr:BTAD domain-containing putative transcriptional regulator [Phytohabitans rumicis]GFJ86883.1 SARP family transcriptional regulator [Phytohabitans rumicis]
MEFHVLGPLRVTRGGTEVALAAAYKQRLTLALLLSRADQTTSTETLVAAVWGDRPPASARRNIQLYVHRLRGCLGAQWLRTDPNGYGVVAGDRLDATRFRQLAAHGRKALQDGSTRQAEATLRAALGLWRGAAYGEFAGCETLAAEADRLDRLRLDAHEDWARAQLALGRHREVITDLTDLVQAHPYRENLYECLMLALYRDGRRAEALELFRRARTLLDEQLGVEPGTTLQRLHQTILRGEEPAVPSPAPPTRVPRHLPVNVAGFVGRRKALGVLDGLLPDSATGPADPPSIVLITGTAGVGKTSLAVHWAHQVADRFPDGQLYVNLRGFDPDQQAMDPVEAIRDFLDAFGVPPDHVPAGPQAQAGLYRSVLADRRVLVVLDNARDAEQVRPLLPSSPRCLALITSRNQLTALLATHGATPLPLDLLTTAEASHLLARRVGAQRIDAEPEAVDDIVGRCAHLPLALAIVAARAATKPRFSLRALADELGRARGRLEAFTGEDLATDVPTVFSWSYHRLTAGAARLFRLLGLHPGPDVAVPAVASLAGVPTGQIRPWLDELTEAHLIIERAPGRYAQHDLLRAYAAELVHASDGEPDRRATVNRMLDHYLHGAHTGSVLLYPHRYAIAEPALTPGVTRVELADHAQALAWFSQEYAVLLAAIQLAGGTGHDAHTWQLAWALYTYADRRGHWNQHVTVQHLGLHAAQRLDDPVAQAHSHHCLGSAYTFLERYDEAHRQYERAIGMFDRAGNQVGRAHSHLNRALVFEHDQQLEPALEHAQQSLDLFRAAGHRSGQAKALNAVGWYQAALGQLAPALVNCQQALDLLHEMGDRYGQGLTWDSVGYVQHLIGDYDAALLSYQHSVDLWQELGDRHTEATVLQRLGDSHLATGDADAATDAWRRALAILEDIAHADADQVRHKLAQTSAPPATQ